MIKEVNKACEKFNDYVGVSVKLPVPNSNTLKFTSAVNFVVGAILIGASVVFAPKWCAVIGGVGIVSGLVLQHKAKRLASPI